MDKSQNPTERKIKAKKPTEALSWVIQVVCKTRIALALIYDIAFPIVASDMTVNAICGEGESVSSL